MDPWQLLARLDAAEEQELDDGKRYQQDLMGPATALGRSDRTASCQVRHRVPCLHPGSVYGCTCLLYTSDAADDM
eukprot:443694-Alexandrium_andersonii.AAC.1